MKCSNAKIVGSGRICSVCVEVLTQRDLTLFLSGLTQFCACLKKVETDIGTTFLNKICTEFFLV